MNFIPPRHSTPIFTPRAVPDHPDNMWEDTQSDVRDNTQAPPTDHAEDVQEDTLADLSGQAPDGWITRPVAQERLELAGIHLDGRRIRHLCARNELESFRGRNEKNQPQYFINPVSLDEYIAKSRPADLSGNMPDQTAHVPDKDPAHPTENVEKNNPEPSGQNPANPDSSPDENHQNGSNVSPVQSGQMPDGEWVPKAQLDQALEMIEFLQEEVRHARTAKSDTARIANRMLETLETLAVGGRLGPAPEPKPDIQPAQGDGEGGYETPRPHGV